MKRVFGIAAIVAVFAFASCTEKGPIIDFGGRRSDTTYVQTNDTVQQRNVLIEEFTGVSCSNCPKGHALIASLETSYPGRIVAVGLYEKNNINTDPNPKTVDTLNTDDATAICNSIYGGVNTMPGAGIDRVEAGSPLSLQLDRSIWGAQVATRINVTAPVSLYVTSQYDDASRIVTVTVRAVFTQAFSNGVRMTLGVTEDSINEAQEDNNPLPIHYDSPYMQNHVLRATISQPTGDIFLTSIANKEVGRVYQRTYTYTLPNKWVANNCNIFAFVQTDGAGSQEILQAAVTKLK